MDHLPADLVSLVIEKWINFSDFAHMHLLEAAIRDSDPETFPYALRVTTSRDCPAYRRNAVFEMICHRQATLQAEWLFSAKKDFITAKKAFSLFQKMCAQGKLAMAKWLMQHFRFDQQQKDLTNDFKVACLNGHKHVLQWLATWTIPFKTTAQRHILAHVCISGHLSTCRYLIQALKWPTTSKFQLVKETVNMMVRNACWNGHLKLAKWLVKRFPLDQRQIQEQRHDIALVHRVLTVGSLPLAKWFQEQFHVLSIFSNPSKKKEKTLILESVLANGSLLLFKWLICGLRVSAIECIGINNNNNNNNNNWLVEAINLRRQDIASWFLDKFYDEITDECSLELLVRVFYMACERGCFRVAHKIEHVLTQELNMCLNDEKSIRQAFLGACQSHSVQTANFLWKRFRSILLSSSNLGYLAFKQACISGSFRMANWLYREFRLQANLIQWAAILKRLTKVQAFQTFCLHYQPIYYCGKDNKDIKDKKDGKKSKKLQVVEKKRAESLFLYCCRYDHLDLAQWLVQHFDLTSSISPFHVDSCSCSGLPRNKLSPLCSIKILSRGFIEACKWHRVQVAKWLWDNYDIVLPNPPQYTIARLFEQAVIQVNRSLVYFLATCFNKDINKDNDDTTTVNDQTKFVIWRCLRHCLQNNYFVKDWIIYKFRLSTDQIQMYMTQLAEKEQEEIRALTVPLYQGPI